MSSLSLNFLRVKGREESELYRYNWLIVLCCHRLPAGHCSTQVSRRAQWRPHGSRVPAPGLLAHTAHRHRPSLLSPHGADDGTAGQAVAGRPQGLHIQPVICDLALYFGKMYFIYSLFKIYLSIQHQIVFCNGSYPIFSEVKCGILQWSVVMGLFCF